MSASRELLVIIAFCYFIPVIRGDPGCGQINCKQIWYDGQPKKELAFYMYENLATNDSTSTTHWQWITNMNEKWTVYYKEWPRKATTTGGFIMTNRHVILAKLSWKISNGVLLWTTLYRRRFTALWNGTICNSNIPMKLESANSVWIFHLGDVKIVGGKSGQKTLDNSSILLNGLAFEDTLKRTIREAEDMEGDAKKQTTWNKIKGWFKELFDQSEVDQRGWLTRLSDWFLGFLERALS